jgi:hypothetical protein
MRNRAMVVASIRLLGERPAQGLTASFPDGIAEGG